MRIIQAILADDEGIILKGLKKLINWEGLGIRIVGEAGDGGGGGVGEGFGDDALAGEEEGGLPV